MSILDLRAKFAAAVGASGRQDQPPPPDTEPRLDPAVVASVARRAAERVRRLGIPSSDAGLVGDLEALALEADDAVERRGPLSPLPFRGRERALPSWWREEYVNDPLLGALAQMGVPAGRALVEVVAAYWSLRGIMVSAAMYATPPLRIEMPDTKVARAAKAAVGAAHPIGGIGGPGYMVPEAEFRALAGAMGQPPAK